MNESKFKKGNFVRKFKGSWWEGRVVGFYDTAENPDGVAVQLDKPNGPVQIYPAAAMELMPSPADQVGGSELLTTIKEFAHWHHLNEVTIAAGKTPSDSEIDFEATAWNRITRALFTATEGSGE